MKNYTISQYILLGLRKAFNKLFKPHQSMPACELDPNKANAIIYKMLADNKTCMITRFGAVEISALVNYIGVTGLEKHSLLKFITGEEPEWWWNEGVRHTMTNNAGFFPATDDNLVKFGELMMSSIHSIDVLGSWQPTEKKFIPFFSKASLINFLFLDPYWSDQPWTRVLEGKKVLVVHPFAELIEQQYQTNRTKLFKNKDVLPLFDLKVVKAVQSVGGSNQFIDWFEALDYMKKEIDKHDYDICLLGCGAYGLPLASHVKNKGYKAVHVGGTLQLLFGIWGKRWDNPKYGEEILKKSGAYTELRNEFWVQPGNGLRPENYKKIEDGCYW